MRSPQTVEVVCVMRGCTFLLLLAGLLASSMSAAERPSRWRVVWRVSQMLTAGASAADAATSWGKAESNPMLSTGARFSYGSLGIKIGTVAGALAAQHFLVRRNPKQTPLYACSNLAAAGVLGFVAAHNARVPAAK